MKLSEFKLNHKDFKTFGRGLQRPECVWIDDEGIWVSDIRGGVANVMTSTEPTLLGSGIAVPNGFSRRPDGSFVVAGIGDGCFYLIAPDGKTRVLSDNFDGKPLGTVNYACADGTDRIWLSMMTRKPQWADALTSPETDGYIVRIDGEGAGGEIVADGLDSTNEVKISPDGHYLYAAETLGCRVVRFPIRSDGSLGNRETFGPECLGRGAFPDGISFDGSGNLWVTLVSQNGLMVIDRHGDAHIVYRDMNEPAVEAMVTCVERRSCTLDHLLACTSKAGPLPLPTSIAFGGPGGRTAYVGSLTLTHLPTFKLPEELE